MEKYKKENKDGVDLMVKKIVNLFKIYKLQEQTKLVAICENEEPEDSELAEIYNDQKTVTLGEDFDNLSTYDKLLVTKATINAYQQITQGELPVFGRVLHFELFDNSPNYRVFDLNGEYMSVFK